MEAKKLQTMKFEGKLLDIAENNLTRYEKSASQSTPNYLFINCVINPVPQGTKFIELCNNTINIIKGSRNATSLQYSNVDVADALAINFIIAAKIMTMDACLAHTHLKSYNDDIVMRDLVKQRFKLNDTQLDNIINNRLEYEEQVKEAKKKIYTKLINLGNWENLLHDYLYTFRYDDQSQYTTLITKCIDQIILLDSSLLRSVYDKISSQAAANNYEYLGGTWWYNTSPEDWYSSIEDACAVASLATAYSALRTDFLATYQLTGLWAMNEYKLETIFSDSDEVALFNYNLLPILCYYDNTSANSEKIEVVKGGTGSATAASTSASFGDNWITSGSNSIVSIFSTFYGPELSISDDTFDSDKTRFYIFGGVGAFEDVVINRPATDVAAQLARTEKIYNIKKPSLARGAEVLNAAHSRYQKARYKTELNDDALVLAVTLGFETISYINAAFAYRVQDGVVVNKVINTISKEGFFVPAHRLKSNPYEFGEFRAVSGLWPQYMLYYSGSSGGYEDYSILPMQEKFDLYSQTVSAQMDAVRYLAEYYLATPGLTVQDKRFENFASTLDTANARKR